MRMWRMMSRHGLAAALVLALLSWANDSAAAEAQSHLVNRRAVAARDLQRLGDSRFAGGDFSAARKAFQNSLDIYWSLHLADPQALEFLRGAAIDDRKLGDVAVATGDTALALDHYMAMLHTARLLGATDSDTQAIGRLTAQALQRVAGMEDRRGDLVNAVGHYTEALLILRDLAAADPRPPPKQAEVAIALRTIGDAALRGGDRPGALASAKESLAIARKLAARGATERNAQHLIADSLVLLARMPESGVTWPDVVAQMESMRARAMLSATDEAALADARAAENMPDRKRSRP
jgi:tetratricopeptide (TPR) repeat protein